MLSENETADLIKQAEQASLFAYAPYSKFRVGAALLCSDGRVFSGCNVENSSFSATVCAERTALIKAVSEGAVAFRAIAVFGETEDGYCVPCGVCRQTLSEFCGEDFLIVLAKNQFDYKIIKLKDIMPMPFKLKK